VPAEFVCDDGSVARFLARIPPTAPRAVLYGQLHIVPMNRADFYVNCGLLGLTCLGLNSMSTVGGLTLLDFYVSCDLAWLGLGLT
jgi:hypothetical protein